MRHTFKAYNAHGFLVSSTWTGAPGSYLAERDAYQARLNRSELSRVDVSCDDPHEESLTMIPRKP